MREMQICVRGMQIPQQLILARHSGSWIHNSSKGPWALVVFIKVSKEGVVNWSIIRQLCWTDCNILSYL